MDQKEISNWLLSSAIENNDTVALQKLLDKGVDLNPEPRLDDSLHTVACMALNLPLVQAMRINASEEIIDKLETAGAKVDLPNVFHSPTLSFAVAFGDVDVTKKLLDRSVSPNVSDCFGNMPLHMAVGMGNLECARLLIEAGGDLFAKNKAGYTPLHIFINSYRRNLYEYRMTKPEVAALRRLLITAGVKQNNERKQQKMLGRKHMSLGRFLNTMIPSSVEAYNVIKTKACNAFAKFRLRERRFLVNGG